jgi:hypothetical protein
MADFGGFLPIATVSFESTDALRDRQKSADCVEKVGLGFHGRKVRVRD